MNNYRLLVIISFISGLISLGFEIMAGFILRPVFGSSVFVWGSVIGSILLGLALGYNIGGRISESNYSNQIILAYTLFLLSPIIAASGFFGADIAPHLTIINSPVLAPLVPSLMLFGPIALLFGFVNPIIISIVTGTKGSVSGRIFSFSTFGSIIGVFLVTFLMIPYVGIFTTTLLSSFILLIVGVIYSWTIGIEKYKIALIFLLMSSALVFGYYLSEDPIKDNLTDSQEIVTSVNSYDKKIYVIDIKLDNGRVIRGMGFDNFNILQSQVYKDDKDQVEPPYMRMSLLPFLNDNDINKSLVLGGGGYVGPRAIHNIDNDTKIDVVEKDRRVYEVAKKHMYYTPEEFPRITTHISDGRQFVRESNEEYDYIFIDVYDVNSIPHHMTTVEFYNEVKNKLDKNGYLVVNVGGETPFFEAQYRTIDTVFKDYNIHRYFSQSSSNSIVIVTKSDWNESRIRSNSRKTTYRLEELLGDKKEVQISDNVPLLTDNKNPADILASQMYNEE